MARDSTTTWLSALAGRVRDLDTVFCCGGTVDLSEPVQLRFRDGQILRVERDQAWRSADVAKRLLRRCAPAPFGVGSQTRRDRRVRHGWQITATDDAVQVLGLDLAETGVLEEIRRVLCPGHASAPEAELHAVNVYREGGHFVSHKDTPRDRDCFGTLVACLPIPFRGGRLVLRHDTTYSYAWALHDDGFGFAHDEPYKVRWAAFYGDVDHEIEKVTSGTRITLTWLLRHPRGGSAASREPTASEDDLACDLVDALDDPEFMRRGGKLGIPCLHLYGETARLSQPRGLSRDDASRLKGRDRLVALAALRAGLEVSYRPYIYEDCANESWRLSRAPSAVEVALFREEQLGLSKLERVMPIERGCDWDTEDDVTWIVQPPWKHHPRHDNAPRNPDPACDTLGSVEYSATDYFGNEGGYVTFYTSAALLLTIPSRRHESAARPGTSFEDDAEPIIVPAPPQAPEAFEVPLAVQPRDRSTDALEDLVGSMTVAELCQRAGVSIESLAAYCLGKEDAPRKA